MSLGRFHARLGFATERVVDGECILDIDWYDYKVTQMYRSANYSHTSIEGSINDSTTVSCILSSNLENVIDKLEWIELRGRRHRINSIVYKKPRYELTFRTTFRKEDGSK